MKMDAFTAGLLLEAAPMNPGLVADLYKVLQGPGATPNNIDRANALKGKRCAIRRGFFGRAILQVRYNVRTYSVIPPEEGKERKYREAGVSEWYDVDSRSIQEVTAATNFFEEAKLMEKRSVGLTDRIRSVCKLACNGKSGEDYGDIGNLVQIEDKLKEMIQNELT